MGNGKNPPPDPAQGLCQQGKPPAKGGVLPCKKTHWIKVRLRYKDDKTDMPAARCQVTRGATVELPGPLAKGLLQGKTLEAGAYEASFPDIDASEWDNA